MSSNSKQKVIVAGAFGRMGKAAVDTFIKAENYQLSVAVVRDLNSLSQEQKDFFNSKKIALTDNLEAELHKQEADILVELTTPDSVFNNSKLALENGVRPVIGATGLSEADINELSKLAEKNQTGAIIAPNFSIGAILMMKFSALAATYMDSYEIVEIHHDKKADSPSGTAIKTAQLMSQAGGASQSYQVNAGDPARGFVQDGINIHSMRLPSMVAHQEVVLTSQGQALTIRHDSFDRSSFMPGIVLACDKVQKLHKLIYGLESLV